MMLEPTVNSEMQQQPFRTVQSSRRRSFAGDLSVDRDSDPERDEDGQKNPLLLLRQTADERPFLPRCLPPFHFFPGGLLPH